MSNEWAGAKAALARLSLHISQEAVSGDDQVWWFEVPMDDTRGRLLRQFAGGIGVMFFAYTWPLQGQEEFVNFVTKQRDLGKYVRDQSLHRTAAQSVNRCASRLRV